MGDVYRADDLKLGQAVALKFLPSHLAHNEALLEKLHSEVRLGRQIAHPNVCRIYDIADWGASHFVAMEYVDGEDLARLLRRIGRLPQDKAIEIARGIAAGLAAAHAKGILHRDLKPANIMIDSHGEARIMDFGLALTHGAENEDIAGTPAYMAPEQLIGRAASPQSDIYALGLVMYETFTGKRAYTGSDISELRKQHDRELTVPSAYVRDVDANTERVILRCLNRDPEQRPRSAREVYELLPGGDALAAAIAAGETPSPRAVAAAGTEGSLSRAQAWGLLALIAVLTFVVGAAQSRILLMSLVPFDKPPAVLEQRAVDIASAIGLSAPPYRATGFHSQSRYFVWVADQDRSPSRWNRLRHGPPALVFWTRLSRRPLTPIDDRPMATLDDPALSEGGANLEIDTTGRLVSLSAMPLLPSSAAHAPDWPLLFAQAGLDEHKFTAAPPHDTPALYADARAAWNGVHPDDGTPLHVEAAAARGLPVYFHVSGPWEKQDTAGKIIFEGSSLQITLTIILGALTLASIALAAHNLQRGRGDRRGAFRLAAVVFLLEFFAYMLACDYHIPIRGEPSSLAGAIAVAAFWALVFYVLYIALEPYVRRHWPERLISWTRLMSGKWRDPMVGRDVLVGIAGGVAHASVAALTPLITRWLSLEPPLTPHDSDLKSLLGLRYALSHVLYAMDNGIASGLILTVLLVTLTILLRRRSLGIAALVLLILTALTAAYHGNPHLIPFGVAVAAILTFVLVRSGLLAVAVLQAVFGMTFAYPFTFGVASWATSTSLVSVAIITALSVWAFKTSLGGQSIFLEED